MSGRIKRIDPKSAEAVTAALSARTDAALPSLVAVSGGMDSMVLWQALREAGYADLLVVHVDHGLRGEQSRADADFVRAEAARLGSPCEIRSVDVAQYAAEARCSVETAARELRYRAFAGVARESGRRRIFLAHHADDQVETVLMRFFRGAGSRGLAGMASESSRRVEGVELTLLRPLLEVSREAIVAYAERRGLSWREDASNQLPFALRNRVRHRLLPEIESVFGREVRGAILRAASLAALDEAWVGERLGELPRRGESGGLDVAALRGLSEAQRHRLLLAWLRERGVPDCGWVEVQRCAEVLMATARPAQASLPGGHRVRRRAGTLFIEGPPRD